MKDQIIEFISQEIVVRPELLPLTGDSQLIELGILDSLSLLKLSLFLEERFGVTVAAEDLTPDNFATVDTISEYLQQRLQEHGSRT